MQRAERAEAHVHVDEHRHRQRDRCAARLGRVAARVELIPVAVWLLRVDGEDVPVERPARRERHVGHQRDLVVAKTAQRTVGDVLDGGAFVVAERAA